MKLLSALLLALLTGCSQVPPISPPEPAPGGTISEVPPASDEAEEAPGAEPIAPSEELSPEQKPEKEEEEENYLPVSDWLVQRKTVCEEDTASIDLQLERYLDKMNEPIPENGEEKLVQAYSRLKALMLASCDPARTPGLISRFLRAVQTYSDWPVEYEALFDLLEEEYRAYALLEEKYQELEARHQKTIEGIGNIERSLESQVEPSN